jgi:hypothetical protein
VAAATNGDDCFLLAARLIPDVLVFVYDVGHGPGAGQ